MCFPRFKKKIQKITSKIEILGTYLNLGVSPKGTFGPLWIQYPLYVLKWCSTMSILSALLDEWWLQFGGFS